MASRYAYLQVSGSLASLQRFEDDLELSGRFEMNCDESEVIRRLTRQLATIYDEFGSICDEFGIV